MRAVWTTVRIVVVLACVVALLLTSVFVTGPSGTSIDPIGAAIDVIAVGVLLIMAWSLWHDRRALV
jgi:hypothetical protein